MKKSRPLGKLDELPPRETQDVGEAEDIALARAGERDRVGAPVHLPLDSGVGFKADDGLAVGFGERSFSRSRRMLMPPS